MERNLYTLQSATTAAVAISNSQLSGTSSTSTDDQSGISSADVSVCSTTSSSSSSDIGHIGGEAAGGASGPALVQLQQQHQLQHRSRPGGPRRVQHPIAGLATAIENQLTVDNNNRAIATDDEPAYDANANNNASSPTVEEITADAARDDDNTSHTGYTNELHLEETDRLLDTASASASSASVTPPEPPTFNRRVSRVRTLSGTPLSVPLNCSAAVLRHGLGTALSTNTGAVDEDEQSSSAVKKKQTRKSATAATTATTTGEFEEIGKRKSEFVFVLINWETCYIIPDFQTSNGMRLC